MIAADQAHNSSHSILRQREDVPSRSHDPLSRELLPSSTLWPFISTARSDVDGSEPVVLTQLYPRGDSGTNGIAQPATELPLPHLSVIVPVFNERSTVTITLRRVLEEPTRKQVIIVDDGSDDGTAEAIEDWSSGLFSLNIEIVQILLLRHPENMGKGRAIRTALEVATGQFVIVQDADLELSPTCYADLLAPLTSGTAELVIGRRRRQRGAALSIHSFGVVVLGLMVRALYGYNVRDAACCFKVLSLDNLRRMNLEANRFEFCAEVIAKAAKLGLRLRQVDVEYFPRGTVEGKKLCWLKDGIEAIQTLWRNRKWKPCPGSVPRVLEAVAND